MSQSLLIYCLSEIRKTEKGVIDNWGEAVKPHHILLFEEPVNREGFDVKTGLFLLFPGFENLIDQRFYLFQRFVCRYLPIIKRLLNGFCPSPMGFR